MRVLFLFLDGIGLGASDPAYNPFAVAQTPTLWALSGGAPWLAGLGQVATERALFLPLDARLGVLKGKPASGSGQAALATGRKIPQEIGQHYGPKPNEAIRAILDGDNLFWTLKKAGRSAALLNPYPPRYFADVERGKRLPGSWEYALRAAGLPMFGVEDYQRGVAIAPDFTGEGWRDYLGYQDAPIYTPAEAGALLARLAQAYDFSLFSTWVTDELGHRGTLAEGVAFLERVDAVLASLLEAWQDSEGLIVLTSDHGNLEDLSLRTHTLNAVPCLLIGAGRERVAEGLASIADVWGGLRRVLGV